LITIHREGSKIIPSINIDGKNLRYKIIINKITEIKHMPMTSQFIIKVDSLNDYNHPFLLQDSIRDNDFPSEYVA